MRLSRTDLVPVLAIIAGGAFGVIATGSVLLQSSADQVPAPTPVVASTTLPLIYIDGVRIRSDRGTPPLEIMLRADDVIASSAVRSALDQWLEVTGTSPSLIDGVQGIEILRGEAAVARYGEEASGGVILVSLRWAPEPTTAQTGTLAGIVTSEASGEPLSNVQISLEGTGLGGLSNNEGRILILGVPAGEHEMYAQLIGYGPVEQTVTVVANETASVGLRLIERAIEPRGVVIKPIETDISAAPVFTLPRPPVGTRGSRAFTPFTPFTAAPSILNVREVQRAMVRQYPQLLRDAGIGGTVSVYFFIDEEGIVQEYRVDPSSGHQAFDDAALDVADVFRFSAALNRDRPVPVWVSFPITFQVR